MTENYNRCKVLASTQMYTLMHPPAPKYTHTHSNKAHTQQYIHLAVGLQSRTPAEWSTLVLPKGDRVASDTGIES